MNQPEASRPGSILRAEREALGVSLREVAETLNLSMTVVQAIEADNLEKLPGAVFARGYVRAYARLLELDPEPLLRRYPRDDVPSVEDAAPTEAPIWEWIRRRPALVLGSAGALLMVVLVVLIGVLWSGNDSDDGAVVEGQPGAGGAAVVAGPAVQDDAPSDGFGPAREASASDTLAAAGRRAPEGSAAADESAADESAADESAADESAAGESAAAQPQTGGTVRITRTGNDRLSFRFSEDCWLEVRSGSGASLYSDLNRAGSQLDLVGAGPFRILLGYAPGARLTFNGEPVPLAPHTRNNVATLVLGQ